MKEKALFKLAFLVGELEVDSKDKDINIPLIKFSNETKVVDGRIMTVFGNNIILFHRTKKVENDMPVFEPVSIATSLR
jgi:hypothetical protein